MVQFREYSEWWIAICNVDVGGSDVALAKFWEQSHFLFYSLEPHPHLHALANQLLPISQNKMSSPEMSDVEVIDPSDDDDETVPDYEPIVIRRGLQKFWKVENKVDCVAHMRDFLKVISLHCQY
jgi:hypothetical protein